MRKFTILSFTFLSAISLFSQIKVFPGGNISLGYTSAAPLGGAKVQLLGNMLFTSTTGSTTSSAYIRGLNAYSTSTNPDYTWKGDSTTGIFHPTGSVLGFSIGGSEKMRIHSNGYVGIGTTSPLEFFQIGDRLTFHNGGTKYFGYNVYWDGTADKRLVADYSTRMTMASGDIGFDVAGNSSAGSAITFTNALQIKNSGNIGIGITSPSSLLSVGGAGNSLYKGFFYNSATGSNGATALFAETATPATGGITQYGIIGKMTPGTVSTCIGVYGLAYRATEADGSNAWGVYGLAGNANSGFNYGVVGILYGNKNGAGVFGGTICNQCSR